MKHIKVLIISLIISLLSLPSWGEEVSYDDLVYRNDLYYKKFTNIPFSGKVTEIRKTSIWDDQETELNLVRGLITNIGKMKNGLKTGTWLSYYESGQLHSKYNYRRGRVYGTSEVYFRNGKISEKNRYNKMGQMHGRQDSYHKNGQLILVMTFKDNKQDGVLKGYYDDGSISTTGAFKGDKLDGIWKSYNQDGSLKEATTWKNGVKQ